MSNVPILACRPSGHGTIIHGSMIDVTRPIHIDEIHGAWKIHREGGEWLATCRSRDEAVAMAAGMARAAGGGEVIVKASRGDVDTIVVGEGIVEHQEPDDA